MGYGGRLQAFLVLCAMLAGPAYFVIRHPRDIHREPGVVAAPAPIQIELAEKAAPVLIDGFNLAPRASYHIEARVLSAEHYTFDKLAAIIPVDLALGWGRMSDSAVLEKLRISQDNRFYNYRWENGPPIPADEIIRSSANMHLVAANASVAKTISHAHRGQIVTLDGELVDITSPNGTYHWTTSMTREDTGPGACEIMWVTLATLR